MKKFIVALFLFTLTSSQADVKISQLPLGTAAATTSGDVVPFVNSSTSTTEKMTLWDFINLPPIATPTFQGPITDKGLVTQLILNPATTSSATIEMKNPSGSGYYNWVLGSQFNNNNTFEITPSTIVDGSTFTSPQLQVQPTGVTIPGTLSVVGNSALEGLNTFGVNTTLTQQIDGDATRGKQINFGTTGLISSLGTAIGGFPFFSFNASQLLDNTDVWHQNTSGDSSNALSIGLSGLRYYHASSSTSDGTFATFWGSSLFSIDNSGNITSGVWGSTPIGSSVGGTGQDFSASTGIPKVTSGTFSIATSGSDYSAGTSALATGILKSTTSTGALTIAVAGDFPTLNQNTSGSAGSATMVATTATSTNSTFYPLFVGSTSNSNQAASLNSGMSFNPSTGTLTTTTFAGGLTGAASGNTSLASPVNHGVVISGSGQAMSALTAAPSGTLLSGQGSSSNPAFAATPILGVNATTAGTLGLANGGALGTTITLQNPSGTTAYNYNFPATAGTAGQIETSGGGGSNPNTWTSVTGTGNIVQSTGASVSGLTLTGNTTIPGSGQISSGGFIGIGRSPTFEVDIL